MQAQSISVFHNARERGLKIIPILNKVNTFLFQISSWIIFRQIDLPAAQPEEVAAQVQSTFGLDISDMLYVSAKTGKGIEDVLEAIIRRIPPPPAQPDARLRAFLFDSL